MAIPNNLIISVHLAEKSILKQVYDKYPQSFDGISQYLTPRGIYKRCGF